MHRIGDLIVRILLTGLLLSAVVAWPGCRRSATKAPPANVEIRQVALVTTAAQGSGFDQACLVAFKRLSDPGVQFRHYTADPRDAAGAVRQAAEDGAAVVLVAGQDLLEAAAEAAPRFPAVRVVCLGATDVAYKVESAVIHLDQASYLCGLLAGTASQTRQTAAVGDHRGPFQDAVLAGFAHGTRQSGPQRVSESVFAEDASADAVGVVARRAIRDGADMILDATGQPEAVAAAVAERPNVFLFGTLVDRSVAFPNRVIASAVIDFDAMLRAAISRARQGGWAGRVDHGLADGVVQLKLNSALSDRLPKDALARVAEAERAFRDGVPTTGPQ